MSPALLSIIVIARDEEAHIARCLESVLCVAARIAVAEVVLVDSRSRDRTVEIARRFPLAIARLRAAQPCTAALARRVGQHLTRGRYILFVDGDSELNPDWPPAALAVLEADATVAGVGGKLREVYYQHGRPVAENPDFFQVGDTPEVAYQLGGNAMYRRAALEAAGSFNPHLWSHEEAELGERLRRAGYHLMRLPVHVGSHHTLLRQSLDELWRRFRGHLMTGQGQVLRVALRDGLFWSHARALNRYLVFLAFAVLGVAAGLASALGGRPHLLLGWGLLAAAGLAHLVVRSGSVTRPLWVLLDWTLSAPAIVWGFVRPVPDARAFALEKTVEWVRTPPRSAPARPDGQPAAAARG